MFFLKKVLTVREGCGIIFKSKKAHVKKYPTKRIKKEKSKSRVLTENKKCVNMIELLRKRSSEEKKFFEN